MLFALAGCGGGGGGTSEPPLPNLPYVQREAAIDLVTSKMAELGISAENVETVGPTLVAYMQTIPEFMEVQLELDPDQLISARFTSGELFLIPLNRTPSLAPDSKKATSLPTREANGFPGSPKIAAMFTFVADGYTDATAQVKEEFGDSGYSVPNNPDTGQAFRGQIPDFDHLSDIGILYIDGHGTYSFSYKSIFLGTSSLMSQELDTQYRAELKSNEIAIAVEPNNLQEMYMISSKYVAKHVQLAPNSFVFLNVCSNMWNATMAQAFFQAGAAQVIGWNEVVDDQDAYESGLFVVDHLLGINELIPQTGGHVATSPSTLARTVQYMQATTRAGQNYTFAQSRRGNKNADIAFHVQPNQPQVVVPSIVGTSVNFAQTQLTLNGYFGSIPGKVFGYGGFNQELEVLSWTPNQVVVEYQTGVTSVQARYGPLLGNIASVQVNQWSVQGDLGPNEDLFDVIQRYTVKVNDVVVASGAGNGQKVYVDAKSGDTIFIELFSDTAEAMHTRIYIVAPNGMRMATLAPFGYSVSGGDPWGRFSSGGYVVP